MNDFSNIRTDFNLIFGQFSVARKFILNGGAIRPTGLLSTSSTHIVYLFQICVANCSFILACSFSMIVLMKC